MWEIVSKAFLLFLVMDPLGNLPVFIARMKQVAPERRNKVLLREFLVALAILIFFMVAGRFLMKLLHISEHSMGIAGGTILFLISIRMIFPIPGTAVLPSEADDHSTEPFVVPLAVPLLAGPSAMTLLILWNAEYPTYLVPGGALAISWVTTVLILWGGVSMSKFLNERALEATERLMGMLLTAISIEMIVSGARVAFNLGA